MRNLLILIPIFFCINSFSQSNQQTIVDFNKIQIHDNLFYYENDKTPYTGKCDIFSVGGIKIKEVSIRDGKYHGLTINFNEDGIKTTETNFKLGIPDGYYSSWYLNGQKKVEVTYNSGKMAYDFIKWDYNGNKIIQKDYIFDNLKVKDQINISSEQDIFSKRERLIKHIWGTNDLPINMLIDSIETDITFTSAEGKTPYEILYNDSGNLKQIDCYKILMQNSFVSKIYHFHPVNSINRAFIYHTGHSAGGFYGQDCKANNAGIEPGLVIPWLLKEGFDVIAIMMPLFGNNLPAIETGNFDEKIRLTHNLMFDYLEHPYTYFIEPLLATVNYLEKNYKFIDISLLGISGGGWTTTLYAAIDPRIKFSFPVAGTIPIYLRKEKRDLGDAEQGYNEEYDPDGLYSIANYEELYVLGSYGENRRQIQILNEFDDCCFSGKRHPFWVDDVKEVVNNLGKGEYDFYLEQDTKTHKISSNAMEVILSSIKDCKLELINEPPDKVILGMEYYFKPQIKRSNSCEPVKNLMYSMIIKPKWLSIDSLSGIMAGKPSLTNLGDTLYSFKTIDGNGGFIIKDVKLKVVR